jgi:hypothetical protein
MAAAASMLTGELRNLIDAIGRPSEAVATPRRWSCWSFAAATAGK